MERIKAEIDWISSHGIEYVYCADGNFGIVDRDEEIAEYIIKSKKATGYPKNFRVCFTKNRTGFVKKICKRFNEYGLDKAQTLSFQSLSPTVLENIGTCNEDLRFVVHSQHDQGVHQCIGVVRRKDDGSIGRDILSSYLKDASIG